MAARWAEVASLPKGPPGNPPGNYSGASANAAYGSTASAVLREYGGSAALPWYFRLGSPEKSKVRASQNYYKKTLYKEIVLAQLIL